MTFDSATLKKFEFLLLASRRAYQGASQGSRRNARVGGGVEFADYRDYAFGDDLRNLDWNVYARLESLFIKRFQEEGAIPVYCFLDASRSMSALAGGAKFDYARKVVGAISYVSLAHFDPVAIYSFSSKIEETFPLARGKERFLALARFLERVETRGNETNVSASIEEALKTITKPGLAVVVSDCFDSRGLDDALERLVARRFDPIVLQIYAPDEARPREVGDFEFVDAESSARRKVAIDERVLKRYARAFDAFESGLRASCVKRGARFYSTTIDAPFETFLLRVARDAQLGG